MILGEKLHALRKEAHWTLKELAQRSGIDASIISRIETGKYQGPVTTHDKLARAFGMSVSELYRGTAFTGEDATPKAPEILALERYVYNEKVVSVFLAKPVLERNMLPQLITLQPGGATSTEQTRFGCEKWLYVLKGTVEVLVGEERSRLAPRESLYFSASSPHQLINVGAEPAECLSVTSPVAL